MYKDQEKQRQANKMAKQRERAKKAKNKPIEQKKDAQDCAGGANSVIPNTNHRPVIPQSVIPDSHTLPNFGQSDCQCMHCQSNRVNGNKSIINHGGYKTAAELGSNEFNRVTLPGDIDYDGVVKRAV